MPFILTMIASLSTMLGTIPIFIKIKNKNKLISSTCAFASGIMLTISIFDLVPEAIKYFNKLPDISIIIITFISILIGIFISMILDYTVDKYTNKNNLYKVGLISMIAIILHNIPEGIITCLVTKINTKLGLSICIAITMHNIPEGLSISIPIYYSTKNKLKAISYTLISALSELLGAIVASFFLIKYLNNYTLGFILSLTAGIMLYISYNKLIPTSKQYEKRYTNLFLIIGIIFMLMNLILNNLIS